MTPHPPLRRDGHARPAERIACLINGTRNDWAFAPGARPLRPPVAPDPSTRPGTGRPIRERT